MQDARNDQTAETNNNYVLDYWAHFLPKTSRKIKKTHTHKPTVFLGELFDQTSLRESFALKQSLLAKGSLETLAWAGNDQGKARNAPRGWEQEEVEEKVGQGGSGREGAEQ